MARPVVHAATEALYDLLPDAWRDEDPATDWTTLRYLSTWADPLGELVDLIERLDYTPPDEGGAPGDTSDLVDPATAEVAWLPWLAQLVGIDVAGEPPPLSFAGTYGALADDWPTYAAMTAAAPTYSDLADLTTPQAAGELTEAELRAAIAAPGARWRRASKAHVRASLEPHLTGSRRVRIVTHVGGDWRQVQAQVYAAEAPQPWALAPALERSRAKAAGTSLTVAVLPGATYGDLAAEFPTYATMTATGLSYGALAAHVPPV